MVSRSAIWIAVLWTLRLLCWRGDPTVAVVVWWPLRRSGSDIPSHLRDCGVGSTDHWGPGDRGYILMLVHRRFWIHALLRTNLSQLRIACGTVEV